jgi:acid phosphatase family membrane protein YuiD
MNIVKELTGNYILNVGIISWFIAQLLKLIYDYVTTKEFDIGRVLGGAGGMPSSHSAVVCSSAWLRTGMRPTQPSLPCRHFGHDRDVARRGARPRGSRRRC